MGNSIYILLEKEPLLRSLSMKEGRIVYSSMGHLFVVRGNNYVSITEQPLLNKGERVENLTKIQYSLFYKIAKNYVNKNGSK